MFHLPQYTRMSNIIVSLNIPSFSVLRRKLVYSMYKRVLASSSSLVTILLNSNSFVTSRIFNSGYKHFLAIMCVRLHFPRVTTHIYSAFYGLFSAHKSFQSINIKSISYRNIGVNIFCSLTKRIRRGLKRANTRALSWKDYLQGNPLSHTVTQ